MQDLTFAMDQGKFNLRVAALILHDDRILVMSDHIGGYFYLPGGRITLHETSDDAIRREIFEELGESLSSTRLRWIVENYFYETQHQVNFHEVCFFYECKLREDSRVPSSTEFKTEEIDRTNHFQWIPIRDLDVARVVPGFLKEKLCSPDVGLQHFVFNEDKRT
jgi:8-oxo-dGTP pyrophosphatase MutT (NUDIX family)